MDRVKRYERVTAILHILSVNPNQLLPLSQFCDMFTAAKSTLSEDIDILKSIVGSYGFGHVETIGGASGGVRFVPYVRKTDAYEYINRLSESLSGKSRVLPGGFLYLSDILTNPKIIAKMGEIIAGEYSTNRPDFVLTMETTGIPVATMTAHALGTPLVVARKTGKVYEGSAVSITYLSSGINGVENMSLPRRAVKEGQRALIVDDFLKGGNTAKGMVDLMSEFNASVVGLAFIIATTEPVKKSIDRVKPLMMMAITEEELPSAIVTPAPWLVG